MPDKGICKWVTQSPFCEKDFGCKENSEDNHGDANQYNGFEYANNFLHVIACYGDYLI